MLRNSRAVVLLYDIGSGDFSDSSATYQGHFAEQDPFGLSEREMEVLRLLVAGLTYGEIASQLTLSFHTVHAHLRSIYSKLGVTSRSQATRFAVEHNLT